MGTKKGIGTGARHHAYDEALIQELKKRKMSLYDIQKFANISLPQALQAVMRLTYSTLLTEETAPSITGRVPKSKMFLYYIVDKY